MKFDTECHAETAKTKINTLSSKQDDLYIEAEHWHAIAGRERPVLHDLHALHKSMNQLRSAQNVHDWMHVHHSLFIYMFVAWILFCVAIMLFRKYQSKFDQIVHPNVTINYEGSGFNI